MIFPGQSVEPAELPHGVERVQDGRLHAFPVRLPYVSAGRVFEAVEGVFLASLKFDDMTEVGSRT